MYDKKSKLAPDQKEITITYKDFNTLLNRVKFIREKLLDDLKSKDEFTITSEYISQNEENYYLNFILTPKYRI